MMTDRQLHLINKWRNSINLIKNIVPEFNNYPTFDDCYEYHNYSQNYSQYDSHNYDHAVSNDRSHKQKADLLKTLIVSLKKMQDSDLIQKQTIYDLDNENTVLKGKLQDHQDSISLDKHCVVCMSQPKDCVNITCHHMCVCQNCAVNLDNKCPMCRSVGVFLKVIL